MSRNYADGELRLDVTQRGQPRVINPWIVLILEFELVTQSNLKQVTAVFVFAIAVLVDL